MKNNIAKPMPSIEHIQYLSCVTSDDSRPIIKDAQFDHGPFYPAAPVGIVGKIYTYPAVSAVIIDLDQV